MQCGDDCMGEEKERILVAWEDTGTGRVVGLAPYVTEIWDPGETPRSGGCQCVSLLESQISLLLFVLLLHKKMTFLSKKLDFSFSPSFVWWSSLISVFLIFEGFDYSLNSKIIV